MNGQDRQHRDVLINIARKAMLERGLLPDFSPAALAELAGIPLQEPFISGGIRDLRKLLWSSIDNDDSLDLDQVTVAEAMPEGMIKILVAIADVDSLVTDGSAINIHAHHNTTTVYTAAINFPMIPEKLSNGLTSLNFAEDRLAVVVEMEIDPDGFLRDSDLYQALIHNHARLTYNGVAAWLEGRGPIPAAVSAVEGLAENLNLQDGIARRMKNFRHLQGALSLETVEARPVFDGDQIRALEPEKKNRAREIIADFMIAANGVTARYLSFRKFPSLRRVVSAPKRWDRIVAIAAAQNFTLPSSPDSKALENFLVKAKTADPLRFPDLSLAVIKLLGSGEYIAELPNGDGPGHFGLAVQDYSHSTAPNRRYPDLVTQRLLKAALRFQPVPYSIAELAALAVHCTEAEDAVNKVERQVGKSAAALLLQSRIGEQFDSIVTGASPKGTWVRLLDIPVEGKLVEGFEKVDVGDQVRVHLISIDVERGYIDFRNVNSPGG